MDGANEKLSNSFENVLAELEQTGVPRSSIEALRTTLQDEAHAKALSQAQSYTKCYPNMDVAKTIDLLAESWEALLNRRDVELKDVNRRINRIQKNEKKVDPTGEKMVQQQGLKAKIVEEKSMNQIGLYRIRALKSLYIQEAAAKNRMD